MIATRHPERRDQQKTQGKESIWSSIKRSPKWPKILPNDLEKDANILATISGLETPRYHPLTHRFSPSQRTPRREETESPSKCRAAEREKIEEGLSRMEEAKFKSRKYQAKNQAKPWIKIQGPQMLQAKNHPGQQTWAEEQAQHVRRTTHKAQ
jgi:hypothetical protein